MKLKTLMVLFLTAVALWLAGLFVALSSGCASAPQRRGEVVMTIKPNRLVIGPAEGHLAEESDKVVTAYIVRGVDCSDFNALVTYRQMIHGEFKVAEGHSLCVSGEPGNRVLFHAVH